MSFKESFEATAQIKASGRKLTEAVERIAALEDAPAGRRDRLAADQEIDGVGAGQPRPLAASPQG